MLWCSSWTKAESAKGWPAPSAPVPIWSTKQADDEDETKPSEGDQTPGTNLEPAPDWRPRPTRMAYSWRLGTAAGEGPYKMDAFIVDVNRKFLNFEYE